MNRPKPYQEEGIAFLTARPRALLGDDAGLGKSLQLIRSANAIGASRILVLCPAVGRISWDLQFAEWDLQPRPVLHHPRDTKGMKRLPDGPLVLIVTFSQLSQQTRAGQFRKLLDKSQGFDVGLVDEAHNLKTPGAQRTKAIYGPRMDMTANAALHGIPNVWAASATFCPLNAGELYPHLRALFPDMLKGLFGGKLPSAWEFTHTFCRTQETPFGTRVVGNNPATIPQLRAALAPYFLMRTKAAVLPQLPALTADLMPLDVRPATDSRALRATEAQVAAMSDEEFLAHAARAALEDPAYSTKRRELGLSKVKEAWAWIEDFLTADPSRKLIVFAHHRDVLADLALRASGLGLDFSLLHGGVSAAEGARGVERFQADPACRLFIGQTRAAGVAITLTAAHDVLLLEPDPSPLINYQALSRAHRLGQTGAVTARFAFADGDPIDKRMARVLSRRASDFEQLFGAAVPGQPAKFTKEEVHV